MSRLLLDANILSDIIRNASGQAAARFRQRRPDCLTSIFVAGELHYGLARHPSRRLQDRVADVLALIPVHPCEPPTERHYGSIRAGLERAGQLIGPNDLWITAHALALDCTLVTANEREFRRVPGLRVENWLA